MFSNSLVRLYFLPGFITQLRNEQVDWKEQGRGGGWMYNWTKEKSHWRRSSLYRIRRIIQLTKWRLVWLRNNNNWTPVALQHSSEEDLFDLPRFVALQQVLIHLFESNSSHSILRSFVPFESLLLNNSRHIFFDLYCSRWRSSSNPNHCDNIIPSPSLNVTPTWIILWCQC